MTKKLSLQMSQPLSTEELEELTQKLTGQQVEQQHNIEDESVIKPMQTKDLQDLHAAIDNVAHQLCDIGPDWERNSTVTRGITAMLP
ncbi:hypothetical protein Trydic_g9203 [Trypoxylus dichotomus]